MQDSAEPALGSFDIVVACDSNRGIGKDNALPWPRLPGDLKHFRDLTSTAAEGKKNVVIMGRKTWESLPAKFRPLPNRVNIVLTRNSSYNLSPDVLISGTLEQALLRARDTEMNKCFIIGGANLYEQAISHPNCDLLYLTEIHKEFDCDTFLSPQFEQMFNLEEQSEIHEEGGIEYCFKTFKHRPGNV